MAYSRNKYKLTVLSVLPKNCKLIKPMFYESLIIFLKEKNFSESPTEFYLFKTKYITSIIVKFKFSYLAIKILEETNDKDSIQTKDEIFFNGDV